MSALYQLSIDVEAGAAESLARELMQLRGEVARGWSVPLRRVYAVYAQLIGMRVSLEPALECAPPLPLDLPEARGVDIEAGEAALDCDPAQPDLWLSLGAAQWMRGNRARGRQLLRRLAASNFPQRARAQAILSELAGSAYHITATS
ncbi:MAG: hypothetical protein Kow0013_28140 [Pararhodobacter sp.]